MTTNVGPINEMHAMLEKNLTGKRRCKTCWWVRHFNRGVTSSETTMTESGGGVAHG